MNIKNILTFKSICTFQFEDGNAILIIKKPLSYALGNFFILAAFILTFYFKSYTIEKVTEHWFSCFIMILCLVQGINGLALQEISVFNVQTPSVIRKKQFFGITFTTQKIYWAIPYILKYEVEYDSYKKITAVWLVASLLEKNESRQLIKFFVLDDFLDFQKLFNEHFPDNKILEWHA